MEEDNGSFFCLTDREEDFGSFYVTILGNYRYQGHDMLPYSEIISSGFDVFEVQNNFSFVCMNN